MIHEAIQRIEGKVVHLLHTGITLKRLGEVLAKQHQDGSRYYDIRCAGCHIARIAIQTKEKNHSAEQLTPTADNVQAGL